MSDIQTFQAYVTRLDAAHRLLNGTLREIERLWRDHSRDPNDEAITALLGVLVPFREDLARHFQEEEQGGCLEEAVARRPQVGREVRELEGQHSGLIVDLDRLIAALRSGVTSDDLPRLDDRLTQFVRTLHLHEAAESRILHQGFGRAEA